MIPTLENQTLSQLCTAQADYLSQTSSMEMTIPTDASTPQSDFSRPDLGKQKLEPAPSAPIGPHWLLQQWTCLPSTEQERFLQQASLCAPSHTLPKDPSKDTHHLTPSTTPPPAVHPSTEGSAAGSQASPCAPLGPKMCPAKPMPKRPAGPYAMFFKENYQRAAINTAGMRQRTLLIASWWKKATAQEREPYIRQAVEAKAAYLAQHPPVESQRGPRRPRSAGKFYHLSCNCNAPQDESCHPPFNKLPAEEKQKFQEMAAVDKKRYLEQLQSVGEPKRRKQQTRKAPPSTASSQPLILPPSPTPAASQTTASQTTASQTTASQTTHVFGASSAEETPSLLATASFLWFAFDTRYRLYREGVRGKQAAQQIGDQWQQLPQAEKMMYERLADTSAKVQHEMAAMGRVSLPQDGGGQSSHTNQPLQ
eukprot:NODE_1819_length_1370_cov_20.593725_g1727_i0.p1 GENE.NODE_1819_length_1370_cov_20.593725_g1727_i0~~NODE_1819_length_1370_cov_20.593725_g1727_i0.p1  ORF type:complete len:430 (+),score=71.44 NODE_1819_length_1370_cov_20.593725_g1727_i0:23-1291(+)